MAAPILPRNFSLSVSQDITTTTTTKRINRFLEMEHEAVASHGLFIAKGDQIPNPFSMLESVNAGSGRIHLRCCYNNKYLSIRSETDHRITPEADEAVEDQSSWNCTMFTVTTNQSTGRTRVEHVHLGRRVVALEPNRILTIDQNQTAEFDDFAVHDVSAILALNLPPFFTFKDFNGNYGQTFPDDITPGIGFFKDVNDFNPDLVYEILPVDVGLIRIRSLIADRCWRSHRFDNEEHKMIFVDTSVHLANLPPDHIWSDGFFNLQRIINANGDVDDNVIAISHSDSGAPMWITSLYGLILYAMPRDVNTPPAADARFVMEVAIRARSIFNVRYNVLAARLLPGHPLSMSTQTMFNGSSLPQIFDRTFSFTETTTTRWNATVAASISVEVSVSMGIPLFASGSITTTYQISGAYEWGADHTTEVTKEDSITITVPPMTTIAVSRWESHGSYDIPFSYTQEDTLYSGKRVVTERHDGLAIGISNHDIFYNVVETPMAPSKDQEAREYRIVPTSSRIVSTPNKPSPSSLSDWILQQPEDTFPALSALRKYVSKGLTSK